jgi:glycosyltransferase involved in cell wall biosynthesis
MACSKYGQDIIKESSNRTVDYAYHGVDHDIYRVTGVRDDVRKMMKWEDKFVITCVASNVRRKQIPRLIQAVSLLKEQYRQKDIVLYLHTIPFNRYWLEGHNLMEVVRMFGVERETFFHPLMAKRGSSIPEVTGDPSNPGLAELYQASDLFVNPSQVEGFGLPAAEAMACGVPTLVTKYAAGWEVVSPAGRGIPIADWEVHKSSTLYANVSVPKLAAEILRLKRNPNERQRMSAMGLERVKAFQWSTFTQKLIPAVENSIAIYQERHSKDEEQDTSADSPGGERQYLRQRQGQGTLQEDADVLEGQG